MNPSSKIGLMDWGIGGFSVYAALRAAGSTADVVYLSDSGNTSYGKLGAAELRARFVEIGRFFAARGVQEVLVGCNAASSALKGDWESFEGVGFHSIIPAGVRAAVETDFDRIGVIGGGTTIASGVYQQRLAGPRFRFQTAQPLSGLVESGELDGARVEASIADVLGRLGPIDALLLACTHYPALAPVFTRLFPDVALLDPATFLVEAAGPAAARSALIFCTTGPSTAGEVARRAFGVEVSKIVRLDLGLRALGDEVPA